MPTPFEPLQQGEHILYGACGGVWVMMLHSPPVLDDILLARPSLRAMRDRFPRGFPLITWVLPAAGYAMDSDSRSASAVITREFAEAILAQATLIEGAGFQAAAVRAIISGIDMLARTRAPKKTFADLPTCASWAAPLRLPAPGQATPAEISSALQAARAAFPLPPVPPSPRRKPDPGRRSAAFALCSCAVALSPVASAQLAPAGASTPPQGPAAATQPSATTTATASAAATAAASASAAATASATAAATATAGGQQEKPDEAGSKLTISGYVEAFYQWNFNRPSNGVTAYRGFDTRHNSFTLANAVLDAAWTRGAVSGRLALQVGHTPETYYLAEPASDGAGSTGTTGASVWKFLQQANLGYKAPLGAGLLLEAGLFLSPIGVEGMAIKDNFSWSRSNIFYGLPFYHTGARATYPLTERLSAAVAGYNGWNSVVDGNREKSISASLVYAIPDRVTASLLYFGGVERPPGAPEGRAFRHLIDAYLSAQPAAALRFYVNGNAGAESNAFGLSSWYAGAAAAQVRLASFLYAAGRGDYFREKAASGAQGAASPIFWPAGWVSSQTATLDARPAEGMSVRLEFRHDQAGGPTYFKGNVTAVAPATTPAPGSKSQNTLTLGATAWF